MKTSRLWWPLATVGAMLALASCAGRQTHEGPDLALVPAGYVWDAHCQTGHYVLPDREVMRQRGYYSVSLGEGDRHGSIVITEFAGGCTREQAESAREAMAGRYRECAYGPLEDLRLDGRTGWGWLETQEWKGRTWSLEYKAVVPYGDTTYSIEFFSSVPATRDTALLRRVVRSFRVTRVG